MHFHPLCVFVSAIAAVAAHRDFSISKVSPKSFADPSPLEETALTVPLHRSKTGSSLSSKYVWAMRTGGSVPQAPVTGALGGSVFFVPMTYGDQDVFSVMDTGSANIWVPETGFQCVSSNLTDVPEKNCAFGPLYTKTPEFERIHHQNFNTTYADGSFGIGVPGYETVTLAGVAVPKQEIGVVDKAYWFGDGHSSGLFGLAYPVVTGTFQGNNASKDEPYQRINYSPLLSTMYKRKLINPIFSIALGRNGNAGTLALGGLPPGYKDATFASAPIQIVNFTHFGSATTYSFYTVNIEGYTVAPASLKERRGTEELPVRMKPDGEPMLGERDIIKTPQDYYAIVDSGTTLNYVDDRVAKAVTAAFNPPGYFRDSFYFVDCNAVIPKIGVVVGGTTFNIHPEQMVTPFGDGRCISGFQGSIPEDPTLHVMGDVFMQAVLAVFDVGASEMRFTQR